MHPVILMPGIMGTVLHATANIPETVELPDTCPRVFTYQLIWIDVKQFLHYKCLRNYFAANYNPDKGVWDELEGMEFSVPKWGSTYAIDSLAPGSIISPFISYYHQLIEKFKGVGYVDGQNLFGAGFDWRQTPEDKWVENVKNLVEQAYEKNNNTQVVLVTHSMGGPYSYYFLMCQTDEWIKKYIKMYIPIAPAWMGASKAFDFMLMGIDGDLPIAGKYFAPLMRHLPGVWFLLPWAKAFSNYTLAKSPSKTYSFDMLEELLNDGNMSYVEGKLHASRDFYAKLDDFKRFPGDDAGGIPVREFVGYNKDTVYGLNFVTDIQPHDPDGMWEACTRIYGDGDETVPLPSALYAANKWKNEDKDIDVFMYKDVGHTDIISDPDVMQKVLDYACDNN